MRWDAQRIAGVSGQRFVITGANSGLGFVTARELARAGADVTLAVRNEDKGREAAARISGSVDVEHLDLADLSSVRRFAESTAERGPIYVLINNAGIMYVPFATTADGFELQMGTNHLGHFALTNLLLPSITGKVVTLSSMAHRQAALDVEDLDFSRRKYSPIYAYGASKLANLLFTSELNRKLDDAGSRVVAVAAHPGYSDTNLQGHSEKRLMDAVMRFANRTVAQSAEMGALQTRCMPRWRTFPATASSARTGSRR